MRSLSAALRGSSGYRGGGCRWWQWEEPRATGEGLGLRRRQGSPPQPAEHGRCYPLMTHNTPPAEQAWRTTSMEAPPKRSVGQTENLCRRRHRLQRNLRESTAQPGDTPEWLNKLGSTPQKPRRGARQIHACSAVWGMGILRLRGRLVLWKMSFMAGLQRVFSKHGSRWGY